MSRRLLIAIAAMFAFRSAAAEPPLSKESKAVAGATALQEVHEIFADTAKPAGMDVLIARIGPDGKPVIACVSTEEAARRFLASNTPAKRAEEK